MRTLVVIQLGLICILPSGAATAEQGTRCDDFDIRVIAPDTELEDQICAAVLRGKSLLESCHLVQIHPLVIRVRREGAQSGLLAHFNPQKDQIVLPPPRALAENLAKESAYRVIPTDHLYDSFVVHELAHAFFAKTKCGLETCRAGHEYIAYAMQLDSLPEKSRALFLAEVPSQGNVDFDKFSDFYHDLMPESFAVDAWRHFSEPGHGCEFIGDILSGEVSFSSDYE